MSRTNHDDGYHEHICTECGSTELVASQDSPTGRVDLRCWDCQATGARVQDRHCLYDWDERFEGCVGLKVVDADGERVIDTAVALSEPNDVGIYTRATEVA